MYNIFVPEPVPLHNKGEEAIIRGMADVVFPDGNATFHVLDMSVRESCYTDRLWVHPGEWFYSKWRSLGFGLGWDGQKLYASGCAILRHGLNRFFPSWVNIPPAPLRTTIRELHRLQQRHDKEASASKNEGVRRLLDCNFVICGHDGVLDENVSHVVTQLHNLGLCYGVFGSSMRVNLGNRNILRLINNFLQNAQFAYFREPVTYNWVKTAFPGISAELAPDPAFGMRPVSPERVEEIILKEGLTDFFHRPVVMVTSAEPDPISRHCFCDVAGPEKKLDAHRHLFSRLLLHVMASTNANILFLPHTVGPSRAQDDREIAKDILDRTKMPADRIRVLQTEYPARDLKGLIGKADFLIAERIHSLIGSVGVQTPFMFLGSRTDKRVTGIVGDMLKCEEAIFFLNCPNEDEMKERFNLLWNNRYEAEKHLQKVSETFSSILKECAQVIRAAIDRCSRR